MPALFKPLSLVGAIDLKFLKIQRFLPKKCERSHLKDPLPLVRKMSALDNPPGCGRL